MSLSERAVAGGVMPVLEVADAVIKGKPVFEYVDLPEFSSVASAMIRQWVDRQVRVELAIREMHCVRLLAAHPWSWNAFGLPAWCEARR